MSDKTPEELANEAGVKGTFNFRERLQGRSYAKDDVVINLDEELGYLLVKLQNTLADTAELDADRVTALEAKIEKVKQELRGSEYVVHMEGFSNEHYDELLKEAKKTYPVKYTTTTSPLTGQKTVSADQSDERDELFNRMLWRESIKFVVDADGNVDNDIDDAFIEMLLNDAPSAVLARIADTINKLRVSSDWIQATQDEDFLAKP